MLQAVQTVRAGLRDKVSVGRQIVGIASLFGIALFLWQLLAEDEDLYPAFLKGVGAAFAVMVLLGTAQQFWGDRKINRAQGPAGTGGVTFEDETKATQKAVDDLNTRVTKQMGDLNTRLYDLESAVFKPNEPGDDEGE
jgi:hypothetical protein